MKNKTTKKTKSLQLLRQLLPLVLAVLGLYPDVYAQGTIGELSTPPVMPTVLAPSPTVAALMKFEEVQVNNYNGIPDINIPIYTATAKGGISLDVKLGYHPSNINANLVASDSGLGWSLFAGGTISRTVKGMPDEVYIPGKRLGIYRTVFESGNNINRFYEISNNMDNGEHFSPANQETTFEYMWDVMVGGKLDTEHDLYQYNFMGYSGRFIIQKKAGILEVVKLDKNPLKIANFYNPTSFVPNYFEITDEKGVKYKFDVVETTTTSLFTGAGDNPVGSTGFTYRSAFHLSKVYDSSNILAIDLSYTNDGKKEMVSNSSQTFANVIGTEMSTLINNLEYQGLLGEFNPLPSRQSSSSQQTTLIRKLSRIKVIGQGRIDFTYTVGRPDSNILGASSAYKLSQIAVKTWKDSVQHKRFAFTYDSSKNIDTRMILSSVQAYDKADAFAYDYQLYYKETYVDPTLIGKDYWGYINQRPVYMPDVKYQETTPQHTANDVLELMKLPTGGAIKFNFEANRYSHIGAEALTNFDDNPDNWEFKTLTHTFTTNKNNTRTFFSIFPNDQQVVYFQGASTLMNSDIDWRFRIYRVVNGANVDIGPSLWNRESMSVTLTPGDYMVSFDTPGTVALDRHYSGTITAYYKRKPLGTIHSPIQVKKYLYGGGVRIKNIQYYKDFNLDQINDPTFAAEKQTNYSYSFFTDNFHSSGSLVYPKPVFKYTKQKRECMRAYGSIGAILSSDLIILSYDVTTTTDNLSVIKTKGSEVGYKNVTVSETGNGRSEFGYTSAIDFPETLTLDNLQYPYLPTENIDYKRGNLLSSKTFDQQGRILEESLNGYDYTTEAGTIDTGIRFYYPGDYQFLNYFKHANYNAYASYLASCTAANSCFCFFGQPYTFITYARIKESFGTANLISSVSKQYFYENDLTVQPPIESSSVFTYDPYNKKLSTQVVTQANGETLRTEYYYARNLPGAPNALTLASKNMIAAPLKIVNFKNGEKMGEQAVVYKNWGNNVLAPELIQSSKGTGALENRVRYTLLDTSTGNPLEVQQEGGTKICYIWGYNKTVPVAKIENMAYANIPIGLINTVQAESDLSVTGLEANLLLALKALRDAVEASGAFVTTMTYVPLVGVSTSIDPRGSRTTYAYDNSGRLLNVRDHENKFVSQHSYNYRP